MLKPGRYTVFFEGPAALQDCHTHYFQNSNRKARSKTVQGLNAAKAFAASVPNARIYDHIGRKVAT